MTNERGVAISCEVNDRVVEPLNSCLLTFRGYVFVITFFVEADPYVTITKGAKAMRFVPHANPIRVIDKAPSWLWVLACTSDETKMIRLI
jgi:hypothetical protein